MENLRLIPLTFGWDQLLMKNLSFFLSCSGYLFIMEFSFGNILVTYLGYLRVLLVFKIVQNFVVNFGSYQLLN